MPFTRVPHPAAGRSGIAISEAIRQAEERLRRLDGQIEEAREHGAGGVMLGRELDKRRALVAEINELYEAEADLDECANCGGSTAVGTPDPHVCGEIGGAA